MKKKDIIKMMVGSEMKKILKSEKNEIGEVMFEERNIS